MLDQAGSTPNTSDMADGEKALRAAIRRWRAQPQANDGPLEAIILSELGRIRQAVEGLEQIILVRLFLGLEQRYNQEELRSLCFELGLDYDDLPGEGRSARIRELIAYLHRHGRIGQLVEATRR